MGVVNAPARQERLVRIMRRRGHGGVSALAADLDVSRRTVLRDLDALRARGFRIDSSAGRGGGVHMDPDSILVSPQLTVGEVLALMLAVATLRATPWMPLASAADTALSKIERSLPKDRLRGLRRVLERVLVGAPGRRDDTAAEVHPALLSAFEEAFSGHRLLAFSYRDRDGRSTRRVVEPQALLIRAPLWYVIAWDPSRAAMRLFRMDRIGAPRVRAGVFAERPLGTVQTVCPDARPAVAGDALPPGAAEAGRPTRSQTSPSVAPNVTTLR